MRNRVKWLLIIVFGLAIPSMLGVALMAAHRSKRPEADEESKAVPPDVSPRQTGAVTLDPATQDREGIRVEALKQISRRGELTGIAVVLSAVDLANARNSYFAAAHTNLQRDRTNLRVARSQYERVKKLYEEDQNMSLKAMQDAESAYHNSEAQLATDQQDASLELDVVRQQWGKTVAAWIANGSKALDAVLEQRDFLLQVTFPPGYAAEPPATVSLALPGDQVVRARFVSELPQVNPAIQSVNFLYAAPARPGLGVGMNLEARIPVGRLQHGSLVSERAVVWWQGAAWVYEKTSADTFTRHAVPTNEPVAGGYFAPEGTFAPGTQLVTTGASALLSEELLVHTQGEEADSDDD